MKKKNLLVFDTYQVETLLDKLNAKSEEPFEVVECRNPGSWSKLRHQVAWIQTALKHLFRRPNSVKHYVAWLQTHGIYLSLLNRFLPLQRSAEITVMMFIYNGGVKGLRHWIFKTALNSRRIKRVFVYSSPEIKTYSKVFPKAADKFAYVHFPVVTDPQSDAPKRNVYIAVGKSNRDYEFLCRVFANLDAELEIICHGLELDNLPPNVTIVSNCFGQDMWDKIASAKAVLCPLKNPLISSGQLVALNSQQLGTPFIGTDIDGIRDYITDGVNGLLVNNSVEEWVNAIKRIEDRELRDNIIAGGKANVRENHSIEKFSQEIADGIFN